MPIYKSPFEKGKLIITFSVSTISKFRPLTNYALQVTVTVNTAYRSKALLGKVNNWMVAGYHVLCSLGVRLV